MGGSNLAQATTNQFWVDPIYRNTRNEAPQLSLLVTKKGRKKELPYFFDQTMQLLAARFYAATIRGHLESPQTSMTAG